MQKAYRSPASPLRVRALRFCGSPSEQLPQAVPPRKEGRGSSLSSACRPCPKVEYNLPPCGVARGTEPTTPETEGPEHACTSTRARESVYVCVHACVSVQTEQLPACWHLGDRNAGFCAMKIKAAPPETIKSHLAGAAPGPEATAFSTVTSALAET